MAPIFIHASKRVLAACVLCLLALCAAAPECLSAPETKRVVLLDVRIENDIGVENAGPIATRWLADSISRESPGVRVIRGEQAAELARLRLPARAEDISRSAAVSLMKSIDATHIMGCEIFLWEGKYGVTVRLIELPKTARARIERVWANDAAEIPDRIDELARELFSPARSARSAGKQAGNPAARNRPSERIGIPPKAQALLARHPEMVFVPGGKFVMGNENDSDADNMPVDSSRREGVSRLALLATEKPRRSVELGPFLIDKYEVTNAEYKKFRNAHDFPREQADYPVTGISWHEARAYASWAGKRLPTEEEWEKAARGVDGRKWPWGDIFERGKCNLGSGVARPGSFPGDKSPYGAYDMAANVQEWTSSAFVVYPGNKSENIRFDSEKMVVRGSYYGGNDFLARCSMRFCALPGAPGEKPNGQNYEYIGFRCAMDID
jgi:iron(II)-dependent oxidoreductase